MSISNSLVVVASAAKDASAVKDAAASVAQNATTLGGLIEFQVTGLLVVFVVLGGLTLMCVLLAKIIQIVAPDQYYCRNTTPAAIPAAKPAPVAAPAAGAASIHPGLTNDELIAILAVAATEAVGQAVSVVKFRHMGSMDWTWSVQGRVSLHASHKL